MHGDTKLIVIHLAILVDIGQLPDVRQYRRRQARLEHDALRLLAGDQATAARQKLIELGIVLGLLVGRYYKQRRVGR